MREVGQVVPAAVVVPAACEHKPRARHSRTRCSWAPPGHQARQAVSTRGCPPSRPDWGGRTLHYRHADKRRQRGWDRMGRQDGRARRGALGSSGGSGRGSAEAGTAAMRPEWLTGVGARKQAGGCSPELTAPRKALGRVARRSMGPERHHQKRTGTFSLVCSIQDR